MKDTTLVYLRKEKEVCLALKKRGFGIGKWNGYGGKIENGETAEASAVREVYEESGVTVQEPDLVKSASLEFFFVDGLYIHVHVFCVHAWEGEPVETEEMRPQWYAYTNLPFDSMWSPDRHWLPRMFGGEELEGRVWFKEDGETIERIELKNAG